MHIVATGTMYPCASVINVNVHSATTSIGCAPQSLFHAELSLLVVGGGTLGLGLLV